MLVPWVITLLAAAGGSELKLASPGFQHVNIPDKVASFYADHFAQELTLQGVHVVTALEIQALIGVERQRQLLSCSETSASCLAEMANALGADGVVTGSLGKFEGTYQLDIEILSATDATPLAVYSARADGDKALLDELGRAAKTIAAQLKAKSNPAAAPSAEPAPPPVPEVSRGSGARAWAWVPAAAGGVLLLAGGSLIGLGNAQATQLANGTGATGLPDANRQASAAETEVNVGIALAATGGAALAAAAVMYFTGTAAPVQVGIAPQPGGVGLALAGAFP